MAKEQVLGFKPAPRLEQVDDEHSKRMQKLSLTSVVLNFSVVISEHGHKMGRHLWGICYGTFPGVKSSRIMVRSAHEPKSVTARQVATFTQSRFGPRTLSC